MKGVDHDVAGVAGEDVAVEAPPRNPGHRQACELFDDFRHARRLPSLADQGGAKGTRPR